MFTPQRKGFTTPNKGGRSGDGSAGKGKGKAVVEPYVDEVAELRGSGTKMEEQEEEDGNGETEVWRRFREAGLLDDASLEKKERQVLVEKVSKLENELYDYQYHMGLLLIEKREWISKYEELRQALAEVQEILKREQTAHLIALRDVEKREENLRKALKVEKQCVVNLEKALHEVHVESSEIKFASHEKRSGAHDLVSNMEENSLRVRNMLHATDAKLAEVSRRSSEMERKLKEVEAHESALQTERQSLGAEKEMNEAVMSKQKEELQDWEKLLQEREARQVESQRILNQQEERAFESDRTLKQKDENLKEAQKKVGIINSTLKRKEDDLKVRLENLARKEQDVEAVGKNVEAKQKELLALEEMLNARQKVEIQKLNEHNTTIDSKKREFELEMDRKKKSFDEELKSKVYEVEQKEARILDREEKICKREQALEKKMLNYKDKEKDLDSKWKVLKEREKAIESEEKELERERNQMLTDKEKLQVMNSELAKERADIAEKQLELHKELENLKVNEEEKKGLLHLQSELKHEKERCMLQNELLLKEKEALKQDREKFEREWELLDEKRAEITNALNKVCQEKEKLDKLRYSEEEMSKNEKLVTQEHLQKELDALRLEKEKIEVSMEHERAMLLDKAQSERHQMLHDFELQKKELEVDMHSRLAEMENTLMEKEKIYKEERERELKDINHLREVADRKTEEMHLERIEIEKVKHYLEEEQLKLQNDIENLDNLVKKLKEEREKFKEILGKYKSCNNCGEVNDFIRLGIKTLQEMEDDEVLALPRAAEENSKRSIMENPVPSERQTETSSLGTSSASATLSGRLLQCTSKIFKISAFNRSEETVVKGQSEESPPSVVRFNIQEASKEAKDQPTPSVNEYGSLDGKALEAPEDSQHSQMKKATEGKSGKKPKRGVRRSLSVKAVVEEAKIILGKGPERSPDEQSSGNAEDSVGVSGRSERDATTSAGKGSATVGRKRRTPKRNEDPDYSEADSDSVTTGRRRMRMQTTSPESQSPGEKRYNLRRRK